MNNSEPANASNTADAELNDGTRKIRVCVVGTRGIPNIMGGIEKHCEQIYPRIAALNKQIDLMVIGRSPYLAQHSARYRNVNIQSVWAVRNRYIETALHTLLAILYARFVARADLVHIHGIGPGLLSPLARLLGMKVLVTHHGANYLHQKWGTLAKIALKLGERLAVSTSQSTIVVSASLCSDLQQKYPAHAHKLLHIPNGATIEKLQDDQIQKHPVLKKFGLQPERYVLAVGRLVPEKGFHDLVQAFSRIQIPYRLVITGSCDHPDEFSRNLQAQQSENIVFTGFQSGEALSALYANAALFVLPSYHEGLPIAALEALSFNRPVLLSDIKPNLDIELPLNCHFPVGDCEALARKLVVEDFSIYRANTQTILARFDWDDIAQRTLHRLSWILSEPKSPITGEISPSAE